jgi:ParB family chromosome partitioning protein
VTALENPDDEEAVHRDGRRRRHRARGTDEDNATDAGAEVADAA